MEVPISFIVQVQRASCGHHRLKHRIFLPIISLLRFAQRHPRPRLAMMRLEPLVGGKVHALSDTKVSIRVVEINIGKNVS